MTLSLRILLAVGAFFVAFYVCSSIRKSRTQMKDTVAWIAIAFCLVIFAVFPQVPIWLSRVIGIETPANLIFLFFIGILLYRNFGLSLRVSMLEDKLITVAGEVAIRDNIIKKKLEGEAAFTSTESALADDVPVSPDADAKLYELR